MKIIKLNESQYNRLFEVTDTTVGNLGVRPSPDPTKHDNSQIGIYGTGAEGETHTDNDKFGGEQTPQNPWRFGSRHSF